MPIQIENRKSNYRQIYTINNMNLLLIGNARENRKIMPTKRQINAHRNC